MDPQNENPYGFIFDPSKQQRPKKLNLQSGRSKILVSVGFVAGVIIAAVIGFNFILSLGKASNTDLVVVRAHQVELQRVIEIGLKNANDLTLRNRLSSLQSATATDAFALSDLLKKRKVEITKLELAAQKDDKTDAALEAGAQDGSHDEVLLSIIEKLSNGYYGALKDAKLDVASNAEKELLDKAIKNLELTATPSQ